MKKIGTITFHAAHNFGSVLQAYALQTFVEKNIENIQYEIINFRTNLQKQFYSPLKKWNNPKNIIKNIMIVPFLKEYKIKYDKFEKFINDDLHITKKEYRNEEELKKSCNRYDYYISGSDQIWNVRAHDFNNCYYLSFVESKNKIAYSPSFGPLKIDWNKYNKEQVSNYLNKYKSISVREFGSHENIVELIDKEVPILVDPTMLLTGEDWRKISSNMKLDFEYILLYCLEPSRKLINKVKEISRKIKLPVVITKYNNKYDYINPFIKIYSSGPKDFISLIDNAKLIISTSFHGTVFSLLLHKPFFTIGCGSDRRIKNLLNMFNLMNRNLDLDNNDISFNNEIYDLDFSKFDRIISNERLKSRDFLLKALEE